ncbi:hypothetical protein DY000_02008810 [Brassica cretica]|uniref:RRM domain-containing protein n=1 Tax=Brassica cretica TaxID=69181 RepID=A0ABQ7BX00_BRACR|nr:hypothetical protein DY000_02008810 [Brassica cretica]
MKEKKEREETQATPNLSPIELRDEQLTPPLKCEESSNQKKSQTQIGFEYDDGGDSVPAFKPDYSTGDGGLPSLIPRSHNHNRSQDVSSIATYDEEHVLYSSLELKKLKDFPNVKKVKLDPTGHSRLRIWRQKHEAEQQALVRSHFPSSAPRKKMRIAYESKFATCHIGNLAQLTDVGSAFRDCGLGYICQIKIIRPGFGFVVFPSMDATLMGTESPFRKLTVRGKMIGSNCLMDSTCC